MCQERHVLCLCTWLCRTSVDALLSAGVRGMEVPDAAIGQVGYQREYRQGSGVAVHLPQGCGTRGRAGRDDDERVSVGRSGLSWGR